MQSSGLRVYKYCDHHGVDILKNLRLKVTPLNEFNDIFEFTPAAVGAKAVKVADAEDLTKHAKEIRERLAKKAKHLPSAMMDSGIFFVHKQKTGFLLRGINYQRCAEGS